jgi:endoglucanase
MPPEAGSREQVLASLRATVAGIPISDTHEHLLAERTRLSGPGGHTMLPCSDAALLLWHYCSDDLRSAGMPAADMQLLFSPDAAPADKWRVLEPWWQAIRHTGYSEAVRRSVQLLFNEDDLNAQSFVRISAVMQSPEYLSPGLNQRLLDAAGIESCQTQSLQALVYYDAEDPGDPGQALQDMSVAQLTIIPRLDLMGRDLGRPMRNLDDMLAAIEMYFDRYGDRAVAVKDLAAYDRRLNFGNPTRAEAEASFARHAAGEPMSAEEMRPFQDFLTHKVVEMAADRGLPVKFHCGYHYSTGRMPLENVRHNGADIAALVAQHPRAKFVLMHMGYPYEAEYAAIAKHYPNAYIDMSWAWILNPAAARRFVGDFLGAAPHTKLLGFGGDHTIPEPVVGHAAMAREGLAQALTDLVVAGRMTLTEAGAAAGDILHDNARRLFDLERLGVPRTTVASHRAPAAGDARGLVQVQRVNGRRQIVDADGQPMALRGVGIGGWMLLENFINGFSGVEHSLRQTFAREMGEQRAERFFDRLLDAVLAEEDVKFIASTGANHIRLSVNYRHLESDARPGEYLEKGFARIDQAIAWAEKYGLKVVIDMHALPGGQNPDWHSDNNSRRALLWQHRDFQDRTVRLWEEIARRYAGNTTVMAYDLLNEPATTQPYEEPDWPALNGLYGRLITAVRAIDPHHIIVVEGDNCADKFQGLKLPTHDNIVISSHNYTGEGFGPGPYPGVLYGRYRNRAVLRENLLKSGGPAYGREHDLPVWVGEFGSVYNGPRGERNDRLRALADEVSVLEEAGIGWCMWNHKDVGVMGWTTPKPQTPYMKLIKPFLDLKRKLGVDHWMTWTPPTKLRREVNTMAATVSASESVDVTPAQLRSLFYASAVADHAATLMQPRFAQLFARLSDEDLDRVANSFRLENCTVNRGILDIVAQAAERGASYRGFADHPRLEPPSESRGVA